MPLRTVCRVSTVVSGFAAVEPEAALVIQRDQDIAELSFE
jgi:hypothetical protein